MKKKMAIGIAVVVGVIAAIGAVSSSRNRFDMQINGENVSQEEYLYMMNQQIYDVIQEVTEGENIQIDEAFWTTEKNGIEPYEKLADATLEELKYHRAVYEVAREQGLVEQIHYEDIVKRMEAENASRKEKIANGEPVYGLSEYSLELFMEYEMDTFQKSYCDNSDNPGMEITEEERLAYYEEYKSKMFVKDDDMVLDYIVIPYAAMDEQEADSLKAELTKMYKAMDEEHTMADLVNEYSGLAQYYVREEILSGEWGVREREIGAVLELGYPLEKGESTQVVDEYETLYLVQCVDKVDYDYQPLEEVEQNIDKELREEHYNQMIAERANASSVDCNLEDVYDFTKKHIKD